MNGYGEIETRKSPVSERHLVCSRADPRCGSCETELPLTESFDQTLRCPECGARVPTRSAPAWLSEIEPTIVALVGEEIMIEATPQAGAEGVTIRCSSCGGTLAIDGSERTVSCEYCATHNFLPDPLWLRLHPTSVIRPWYAVLDADPRFSVLPQSGFELAGLAVDQTGELVLAWGGVVFFEFVPTACVAGIARSGAVRWKEATRDIAKRHTGDCNPGLVGSPDGHSVLLFSPEGDEATLVDTRTHTKVAIARGDQENRAVWREDGGPAQLRPFHLQGCRQVALDTDDSLIVLREAKPPQPYLARYMATGEPQPMWPEAPPAPEPVAEVPAPRGGWSRMLGKAEPTPPPRVEVDPWRRASWDSMPERLLVPPKGVKITVGRDGHLYVIDERLRHVAVYLRDGSLADVRRLHPPPKTSAALAIAVDGDGIVFALAEVDRLCHLLKAPPNGSVELLIGLNAPGRQWTGTTDYLAVAADGRIYLGGGFDSLYAFDASGAQLWCSTATRRADDERRRDIST